MNYTYFKLSAEKKMEDGSSKEFTKIGNENKVVRNKKHQIMYFTYIIINANILQHKRNGIQVIHAPQKAFHT